MAPITILVQSTDSFSDCWAPFFTLLRRYWPDCRYPILLNTETRPFSFPGFDVRTSGILNGRTPRWPTWSESLLMGLDLVQTDVVLFMIDDQFICGPVDTAALDAVVERMLARSYTNITVTEHGHHRPASPTDDPWLLEVNPRARYRITTAPALWRKDGLKRYLRSRESAWQFEIFGSRRSWRTPDTFFIANPARVTTGREGIIPYFQTAYDSGIIKGRWQPEIEPFFREHGIDVDYRERGLFKPLPGMVSKYALLKKLCANPVVFVRGMLGQ
ncbi:MAG: hypothetical protein ACM3NQ_20865 [Bacteroidales bacterium]